MASVMFVEFLRKPEEEEEEEEEILVKHYSSNHRILLVGEGDFSFSLSLARSFRSATNIVASSLDSYDDVIRKYKRSKSNLDILHMYGASLLHGVDATKMKLHTDIKMQKFDRIIYNFPHAGFHGKEDTVRVIKMHRELVRGFFRNASGMLRANGEIHVNHKTKAPFCRWNLEELASQNSLTLIECADFRIQDYPGYNQKRGSGSRCDRPFPLGPCSTFKFQLSSRAKKIMPRVTRLDLDGIRKEPPWNISFSDDDLEGVEIPHTDAFVVSMTIANYVVMRIMISIGSGADILFVDAFNRLGLNKYDLTPVYTPLVDFMGKKTYPLGAIELPVIAGTYPRQTTVVTNFMVVDLPSAYNVIIGRPTLNKMGAILSIYHRVLKFPTSRGVGVVKGDQMAARKCEQY